eukprot:Rhum_TRINITY_DN6754_c0_g1::Rhum_TRINITY_DN6754_c0_g1_i1::g.20901::m.20901/K10779/ATRX; transcriptional regulator ATRX
MSGPQFDFDFEEDLPCDSPTTHEKPPSDRAERSTDAAPLSCPDDASDASSSREGFVPLDDPEPPPLPPAELSAPVAARATPPPVTPCAGGGGSAAASARGPTPPPANVVCKQPAPAAHSSNSGDTDVSHGADEAVPLPGDTTDTELYSRGWVEHCPKELLRVLKGHQVEGISYLWNCLAVKEMGGILAHAMGLGKTLQLIVLLFCYAKRRISKGEKKAKMVVVVPVSLVETWQKEFDHWLGLVSHAELAQLGLERVRQFTSQSLVQDREAELKAHSHGGILLTTYPRLSSEVKEICAAKERGAPGPKLVERHLFSADVVLLDEAQKVKNDKTSAHQSVSAFSTHLRIAATGTPLQNNTKELISLIDWVRPNQYNSEFLQRFTNEIVETATSTASRHERRTAEQLSGTVVAGLRGIMHRRDMSLLAEMLPPLHQYTVNLRISELQRSLYQGICNEAERRGDLFASRAHSNRILLHPAALRSFYRTPAGSASVINSDWLQAGHKGFLDDSGPYAYLSQKHSFTQQWEDDSPKLKVVRAIVEEAVANNEKTLIFSAYVETLEVAQNYLRETGVARTAAKLTGTVTEEDRAEVLRAMGGGNLDVLFLSLGVGAVGLNITAASRVIMLETVWNGADVRQALCRAYRIGQTRPVHVYQLVSDGTVENELLRMMLKKDWVHRRFVDNEAAIRDHLSENKGYYKYTPMKRSAVAPRIAADPTIRRLMSVQTERGGYGGAAVWCEPVVVRCVESNLLLASDTALELDEEEQRQATDRQRNFNHASRIGHEVRGGFSVLDPAAIALSGGKIPRSHSSSAPSARRSPPPSESLPGQKRAATPAEAGRAAAERKQLHAMGRANMFGEAQPVAQPVHKPRPCIAQAELMERRAFLEKLDALDESGRTKAALSHVGTRFLEVEPSLLSTIFFQYTPLPAVIPPTAAVDALLAPAVRAGALAFATRLAQGLQNLDTVFALRRSLTEEQYQEWAKECNTAVQRMACFGDTPFVRFFSQCLTAVPGQSQLVGFHQPFSLIATTAEMCGVRDKQAFVQALACDLSLLRRSVPMWFAQFSATAIQLPKDQTLEMTILLWGLEFMMRDYVRTEQNARKTGLGAHAPQATVRLRRLAKILLERSGCSTSRVAGAVDAGECIKAVIAALRK